MLYFPATEYFPAFENSIKFYFAKSVKTRWHLRIPSPLWLILIKITPWYFATNSINDHPSKTLCQRPWIRNIDFPSKHERKKLAFGINLSAPWTPPKKLVILLPKVVLWLPLCSRLSWEFCSYKGCLMKLKPHFKRKFLNDHLSSELPLCSIQFLSMPASNLLLLQRNPVTVLFVGLEGGLLGFIFPLLVFN